jgi:hypothetical protein
MKTEKVKLKFPEIEIENKSKIIIKNYKIKLGTIEDKIISLMKRIA